MIRAAIIGLGWWGQTIARALAGSTAIAPVLGIDPSAASRATAPFPTDEAFEAALRPGIDAVILCTPHKFHAEQIVAAAAAGKHVFCEKPLCTRAADADRAIAAMEAANLVLGIGHERRFEPPTLELRKALRDGAIGTPLLMEANFSQDKFLALPPDNWRLSAIEAPVGPLSGTGIHLVDLAIAIWGAPDRVWARLATRATSFANGDTLAITLGFPGGETALLSAILATPFDGRIAVYGSQGWMEIRDRAHPERPEGWDVTIVRRGAAAERRFVPPHPAVRDNLEAFAHAALGHTPYPVTHAEMRANVQAFEAITRSAQSGAVESVGAS